MCLTLSPNMSEYTIMLTGKSDYITFALQRKLTTLKVLAGQNNKA